jgi:hypothetical protein
MTISWMLTRDVFSEGGWSSRDLTALVGDYVIGRVYQIEHGPDEGFWFWTIFPGMAVAHPTSGRERARGQAGRCVIEAYQRLLQSRSCDAA